MRHTTLSSTPRAAMAGKPVRTVNDRGDSPRSARAVLGGVVRDADPPRRSFSMLRLLKLEPDV
jgi:hypothetical protein